MKRTRAILFMLGIIACSIVVACAMQHIDSDAHNYTISIDPYLSPVTHIKIIDAIYAHGASHKKARILAQKLHHDFPCIRAVKTSTNPQGIVTLAVEAQTPIFGINDIALMLENGRIIDRAVYNEAYVVGIKQVLVADKQMSHVPSSFKSVIEHFFSVSNQTPSIIWHNEHEIFFAEQQNPALWLLCSTDALPNHTTLERCAHVYRDVQLRNIAKAGSALPCEFGKTGKKNNRQQPVWVADIRFKNQIIVRAEVGGHKYG